VKMRAPLGTPFVIVKLNRLHRGMRFRATQFTRAWTISPRLDYIPALIVNIAKAVMEDRQTAAAETSRRFQFQGSSSCSWETMMAMRRSTPASHA
jgi:hypothetical protein